MTVPTEAQPSENIPRLTEGHAEANQAADLFFGGFCMLMIACGIVSWLDHTGGFSVLLVLAAYAAVNVGISRWSIVSTRPYAVEISRTVIAAVVAPGAYLLIDGPLAPWWPGFLMMCLGATIMFGLITGDPKRGRALVVYYLALYLVAFLIRNDNPDWYRFAVNAGVIAMVGLLFTQIMALLGGTLRKVHDRSMELQEARDALFAEVAVAHEIQTLLLPRAPELPGSIVRGKMVPATEVGGDYYDLIDMHGGRKFIAIGDVSGHGVTSGLTMMMARSSLLGVLESDPDIELTEAYRALNRALRDNLERMGVQMYMTFGLLEVHPGARFVGVGRHLPMMVYRRETEEVEEIDLDGMWLGVIDDLTPAMLKEVSFSLAAGDLLVLYTDGIIEHFGDEDMFGFDRLKGIIRKHAQHGADHLIDQIMSDLEVFATDVEDDVTLFVIDQQSIEAGIDLSSQGGRQAAPMLVN
ncbi:MAG TPA: SpoIIE family protein phosphatase [Kofleriaceae bacterium]|nr:SpoIIE family protein phosphatase [Kofleriaceae bacterium]